MAIGPFEVMSSDYAFRVIVYVGAEKNSSSDAFLLVESSPDYPLL